MNFNSLDINNTIFISLILIFIWPINMVLLHRWGYYPIRHLILATGSGVGLGLHFLVKTVGFSMIGSGLIFPIAGAAFAQLIYKLIMRKMKKNSD